MSPLLAGGILECRCVGASLLVILIGVGVTQRGKVQLDGGRVTLAGLGTKISLPLVWITVAGEPF